jgi:hypothetical protein
MCAMGAKIIDIKTRKVVLQKTIVTKEEFWELADAVSKSVTSKTSRDIIEEMKLAACFNFEFRNKTYPELEELYEDLRKRVRKI